MLVNTPSVFHSNKYCEAAACIHGSGVVRHEPWCITGNSRVRYAYEVVLHPEELTVEDKLILHALGATWERNACAGSCSH